MFIATNVSLLLSPLSGQSWDIHVYTHTTTFHIYVHLCVTLSPHVHQKSVGS